MEAFAKGGTSLDLLDETVGSLARGLSAAGVDRGDRVGIWAPDCAEWTLTQCATATVGAILANLNPAYRTVEFSWSSSFPHVSCVRVSLEFRGGRRRFPRESKSRPPTPRL